MGVRSLTSLGVVLALGLCLLFCGCRPDEASAEAIPGDYIGHCARGEVYVVSGDEFQYVVLNGTTQVQNLEYLDAAILPDGRLLLSSEERGLVAQDKDGRVTQLLEPGALTGGIWLDPSGAFVAFSWPLERGPFSGEVLRRGIGVYSLAAGASTLVLSDSERDIRIFGWVDDKVVFWWNYGKDHPLCLTDMHGGISQLLDCPPDLAKFHRAKGSFLPYETKDGSLVLLDLATLSTQTLAAVRDARWSKDGLQVLRDDGWETIDVGP